MATIELTADTFESTLTGSDIVFVDFWAAWCGHCRMFGPIFEKASEQHPDITFGKVDTEAEQALAAGFQITSIPTLMAVREGVVLYSQPGALPAPNLETLIQAVRDIDMANVRQQLAEQDQRKHQE